MQVTTTTQVTLETRAGHNTSYGLNAGGAILGKA